MPRTSGEKVRVLAHEILHHFLLENINPGALDPAHDTEGIMLSYLVSTNKLGCRTVKALLRAGVDKSEIDPAYVLPDE